MSECDWKIRFGTAGTSDSFEAKGYKTSLDIPAYTAEMGLDAFEYQCGHGVRLGVDKARRMAADAAERGILFSVHAPYYISMSSLEEEKRLNSVRYLLQSAEVCRALGGRRIEHTLSNLATGLGLEERGVRATLQDERSRITFVRSGETRAYPKEEFFYFSAFPMEGRAEGVCERGSYYELTDDVLVAGYPLGVSNEYAEGSDCITISTRKGALVVVETVPDTPILTGNKA